MTPAPPNIFSRVFLLLRSTFWTILVPGTVTLYFPYRIVLDSSPAPLVSWGIVPILSLMPILIGTVILLQCIWSFAAIGRGTLSPVDAPQNLVVQGLYQYVRNPMYVGVMLILLGEALLFESVVLVAYAGGFFAVINLVILLIEEPILRSRFGGSYERYCQEVGRWLPRQLFNKAA